MVTLEEGKQMSINDLVTKSQKQNLSVNLAMKVSPVGYMNGWQGIQKPRKNMWCILGLHAGVKVAILLTESTNIVTMDHTKHISLIVL